MNKEEFLFFTKQLLKKAGGQQGLPEHREEAASLHKANIHPVHRLPIRGLWPESNYFGTKIKQAAELPVHIFLLSKR